MSIVSEIKKKLVEIKVNYLKKAQYKNVLENLGSNIPQSDDFKNNDLEKCFRQKNVHTENNVITDRIIQAYNKAKKVQKTLPGAFQVGNEWLPIYENYMNDIIIALNTLNKADTNKIYENFMREGCSVGLHGLPFSMEDNFFNGKISRLNGDIYLLDSIYRYNHWKELTANQYQVGDLYMPDYGNPYGYYINNEFVRTGAEYFHYYATRISELIKGEKGRKVVVELGGGYGGLGYFLNKVIDDVTYVDFDLPENMALTAYYLMNCYPEKKILLYGEDDFNEESISEYDVIIMPNFEVLNLPSGKADLVFNSYSLAEMSTETINTYITELKRATKKHVFHVNHTIKSNSLKADEFGIEDKDFKLVSKKPALWNLGRDSKMDEFEYLYSK
ncbi:putative sugar O-methyltransferase [Mucilaginibacter sp.]|uniref:putative sugar O-methyltransferase n=1 Tax=Mucilaginibacter sp. TaxID=1882438 RepID=UPI0025D49243|nr:putative sugar O-methyltransferase [Mucilaginibacter sp.]